MLFRSQIIVADNGSTDGTGDVAARCGATVVDEPKRGYGAACYAAMEKLADHIDMVAFLDADLADDHTLLPKLIALIVNGGQDMVIGARVPRLRASGSMTAPQIFGNWLATRLIRLGWGHRYADLGPFRVIRRESLDRIDMKDRAFGWTIEMQIRAIEEGLQTMDVEVPYYKRRGKSKISGTVKGVFLAGYWILGTCARLWWTKRRRARDARNGR